MKGFFALKIFSLNSQMFRTAQKYLEEKQQTVRNWIDFGWQKYYWGFALTNDLKKHNMEMYCSPTL